MARGRPRKEVLSDDDKFEAAFFKAFNPTIRNGQLVFIPSGNSLTLDECQILIEHETRVVKDPITKNEKILEPKKYSLMGLQKIEQRGLSIMKSNLKNKYGIKDISDCIEPDMNVPARVNKESAEY